LTIHTEKKPEDFKLGDSLHPSALTVQQEAAQYLAERGSFGRVTEFCAIQHIVLEPKVELEMLRQEAAREHVVAAFKRFIKGTELNEYEYSHIEPSLVPLYKMFRAFKLSQVK